MADGTEKEFFEIPKNINSLDGIKVGEQFISTKQVLSKDDRSAVINAAAEDIEQKKGFSVDLGKLLKEFNITHKEVIEKLLSRQIKGALSK